MIDEFVKNCNLSDTQLKTLLESTEFDSKLRENAENNTMALMYISED